MAAARRPSLQVVFFDAGGVLVEFPPAERRVEAALRGLGERRPADRIAAAVREARAVRDGRGHVDLLWPPDVEDERILAAARSLASALELPPERAAYLRDTCYHIRTLSLLPDAVPALEAVAAAGLAAGLISNAPGSLRAAFHRLGLLERLRPTIISAEVGTRKPDGAIYAAALRQAGLAEAARALFVDDLAANVAGARAAGMRALLLDRAAAGGDLRSLAELPAHLGP